MIQKLDINKIVADPKVYRKGVERYKEMIIRNEKIKPLIVLKHPKKDLYAVLDGHHRFYALLESGIKEVECSVIKAPSFIFDRIAEGWLQPPAFITKNVRMPLKDFTRYIIQFRKYPEKLLKASRKPFIKLKPYTAKFEFDEKIPVKKRKKLIKWFNSSIRKMKIDKDVDVVDIKIDNSLEDVSYSFDKTSKKISFSLSENILSKMDKKLVFHYIGHVNELIKGLNLEKIENQPEIIKEAAKEIVAMSVNGRLEEKNLPHTTKQERKKSLIEFFKKHELKIDKEILGKIMKRFWGRKVKSEKEILQKAKEVVESLEKEEQKESA